MAATVTRLIRPADVRNLLTLMAQGKVIEVITELRCMGLSFTEAKELANEAMRGEETARARRRIIQDP